MAPFLKGFPYAGRNAHFIGQPIDYIIFDDNEVIFLEVKSGQAFLTQKQKQIKDLVTHGKVKWQEYRISGQVPPAPKVQGAEKTNVPGVPEGVRRDAPETASSNTPGKGKPTNEGASGK